MQCDNPATGTRTIIRTSHSHLLLKSPFSFVEGKGERRCTLEQGGNKEDGYSGPTLAHASPGLNYTCTSGGSVQMWRQSHSSSDPQSCQAGRGGFRGSGGIHLGPLHIVCMTDVRRLCMLPPPHTTHSLSLARSHTHTQAFPRINQTFSDDGGPSVAVPSWDLFGRWSQESNVIVFMQEIKKPPLCTAMEMRGVEGGELRGWINKSAINHFVFAFVN